MRCECGATEVWQINLSADDDSFARRVGLGGVRPRPGEWVAAAQPAFPRSLADVAPGFYCVSCDRFRRDVARMCADLASDLPQPDLSATAGGVPTAGTNFDLERAVAVVRRVAGDRAGKPIEVGAPRPAEFESGDITGLAPEAKALIRRPLYRHQATAIRAGIAGKNVVISTDTASGKSLCYQTVAAHVLAHGGGTVLYLAPITALLVDQLDAIDRVFTGREPPVYADASAQAYCRRLPLGSKTVVAARYDGAVPREPKEIRREIRASKPRFVLTTPEMLVQGLLPNASAEKGPDVKAMPVHTAWQEFFRDLRLVILDELHGFRGVFGAHLANALRRVRRMIMLCGGNPKKLQFFACSATIREPIETARSISGAKDFVLIGREEDKSPRYRRTLVPLSSEGERLTTFASRLLPAICGEAGARAIAFRDHIPEVQNLGKMLSRSPVLQGRIESYCAGTISDERVARLRALRAGRIQCLVSTSALELGIDVGSLNASVLLGFPGTVSKTWQMLGRAGRNGDGLLVYVGGTSYLDEYWRQHPEELIGDKAEPEDVVIDPDNEEIVTDHVRGAALDHALDEKRDRVFFGPAFDHAVRELKQDQVEGLRLEDDFLVIRATAERRAREISLRGLGQYRVPVYEGSFSETAKPLYEEDGYRAPRRLFPGATFVWNQRYYRARQLHIPEIDPKQKTRPKIYAVVDHLERADYLTAPSVYDETQILTQEANADDAVAGWGRVQVTSSVEGYYRSVQAVEEIEGSAPEGAMSRYVAFDEESAPPKRVYRTKGAWFQLSQEQVTSLDPSVRMPAVLTVAEALVRAAPILRFASRGDLTASAMEVAQGFDSPDPVVFINEAVAGGAGLARRVFERRKELVLAARKLLTDCPQCSRRRAKTNGCPRCVALLDGTQDRAMAIEILTAWADSMSTSGRAKPKKPSSAKPPRTENFLTALAATGLTDFAPAASGGMGMVYRAKRGKESVAIKLVKRSSSQQEYVIANLRKEAEVLGKLRHPNIIRLRGVHQLDGRLALEMDWAEGGTLDDFLADNPDEATRIAVWRKIVDGVAHMHAQGLVHRDLKPDNILMQGREPLIADFGLSRVEGKSTIIAGTPDWQAPEQASARKVVPTMDVWALGRVLGFIFTRQTNAVWPDKALPKQLPKPLHDIAKKCVMSSPAKRFADAQAILDELGDGQRSRRAR